MRGEVRPYMPREKGRERPKDLAINLVAGVGWRRGLTF